MKINYMIIILFFFFIVLGLNAVNALDTNLSNCYLNYSVDNDSINNYNFKSVTIEENINTSYNTRANLENVYVNYTGGNDSNNGTNWNNPLKTIEKALNLVNDGGNIYLAKGTILRNSSNQILINKNVNIIGQNQKETIIDGEGIERLFYITFGNVKFMNISLINGFNFMETNSGGGAILNLANNNLIFINVSFINNTAQSGGAIYSDSYHSNLNFINCDFSNNNAVISGGAIYFKCVNTPYLKIDNSSFINNYAGNIYDSGGYGGILHLESIMIGVDLEIKRSIFSNNSQRNNSMGLIYLCTEDVEDPSRIIINNCLFLDNVYEIEAKLYETYPDLNYNWWGHNSTNKNINPKVLNYTNVNVDKWLILNSTFNQSEINIDENASFTVDLTHTQDGLSINGSYLPEVLFNLIPCKGNASSYLKLTKGIGSTIFKPTNAGLASLKAICNRNFTVSTINVISNDYTNVFVDYTNGDDNNLGLYWDIAFKTIEKALSVVRNNGIINIANGVNYKNSSNPISINKNITILGQSKDKAIIDGNFSQIFTVLSKKIEFTNLTIRNGNSTNGGVIFMSTLGAVLNINNVLFINNTAKNKGGAIYLMSPELITGNIVNSFFRNNKAKTGGAIYMGNTNTFADALANFNFNSSTFVNNIAEDKGGAIYLTYQKNVVLNMNYCVLTNNTANSSKSLHLEAATFGGTASISADTNWWGHNNTNKNIFPEFLFYTNLEVNNWLVLTVNSNVSFSKVATKVNVSADIIKDKNGCSINGSMLPNIPVNITSDLGGVDADLIMVNGKGWTNFIPTTEGNGSLIANVYGNIIVLDFEVVDLTKIYVNYTSGNDANTGVSWIKPVKTIEQAVKLVDNNGFIYISDGTTYRDILTNIEGIVVNKAITFIGQTQNNTIIDGKNEGRLFLVNESNVHFINLTIQNGKHIFHKESGGGIYYNGFGNLSLSNVTFKNNHALDGGAIFRNFNNANDALIMINNCIFVNNTALYNGGAIFIEEAIDEINLKIQESIFINNTGNLGNSQINYYGAAIYTFSEMNYVNLECIKSIFVNNCVRNKEGSIYISSEEGGNIKFNYNIFLNNKNISEIYYDFNSNQPSMPEIDINYNWWGHNNTNKNISPYNLNLTNCFVDYWLIFNTTSNVTELDVGETAKITIDLAHTQEGIAIDGSMLHNLPLNITTIKGIINPKITCLVNGLASTEFIGLKKGYGSLIASIFKNTSCLNINIINIGLNTVYVNYTGGDDNNTGINWNESLKTIEEALGLVKDNGVIYLADGIFYKKSLSLLTINKNLTIIGQSINKTIIDGNNISGIFNVEANFFKLVNLTLQNGNNSNGGAIFVSCLNSTLNISNIIIKNCVAINNGGGISFKNSTYISLNILNSSFINNKAKKGGAIYIATTNISEERANIDILSSVFINNNEAIYIDYKNLKLNLSYSILINNVSLFVKYPSIICAENNWWGHNSTNKNISPNILNLTNINVNKWLVLDSTSNETDLKIGSVANILIDLTKNQNNESINGKKLPKLQLDVKTIKGVAIPSNIIIENGKASTNFTGTAKGTGYLIVGVSNFTNLLMFNITPIELSKIYVNYTGGDDENSGVIWESAVKTIEEALILVKDNGIIYIADGTTYKKFNFIIDVNKNITIIGQSIDRTIINGENKGGIFNITSKFLRLINLTLVNGKTSYKGTINVNNELYLKNVLISNSNIGIFAKGSNLNITIEKSIFINNNKAIYINNTNNLNFILNYNILVNNNKSLFVENIESSLISAENNWWGHNSLIKNISPKDLDYTNVPISKWLFLNVTSNKKTFNVGESTNITINLNYNQNGVTIDGKKLPKIQLNTTTDNGLINPTNITLLDGKATTVFTGTAKGSASFEAIFNGVSSLLTFNIVEYNSIYLNFTGGNDNNTGISWSSSIKSLYYALDLIKDNGIVYIADGTFYNDINNVDGFVIDKNLTIIGQSIDKTILDGGNLTRIFLIRSGNVNLINLTIQNCNNSGIYDIGTGNLTVNNLSFLNNKEGIGIAISKYSMYLIPSYLTILNSKFINNTGYHGQTVYLFNLGSNANLNIFNSTFINNKALNQSICIEGSAVHAFSDSGKVNLNITKSTFVNNFAGNNSNLVYVSGYLGSDIFINYNIFLNNISQIYYDFYYTNNKSSVIYNLDYNWWGHNTTSLNLNPKDLNYTNLNITNWLVLNSRLNTTNLTMGYEARLFIDLTYLQNGSIINGSKIPQNIPVVLKANKGYFNFESIYLINGKATAIYTANKAGNESILSEIYKNTTILHLNIKKAKSTIYVSTENIIVGENLIVNGFVIYGATGNVTIIIGNKSYNVNIVNSSFKLTIQNISIGNYTLKAIYNGDDNYLKSTNYTSFIVNKTTFKLNISVNNIFVNEDCVISFILPYDVNGNITIYVNGRNERVKVVNGSGKLIITNLASGNYTLKAIYKGDDKYLPTASNSSFTVSKLKSNVKLTVDNIFVGEKTKIIAHVNSSATGFIKFIINNNTYNITILSGVSKLTIDNLKAGRYNVKAIYNGDEMYLSSFNNGYFNVNKVSSYSMTVSVNNVEEGQDSIIDVILPKDATGKVSIKINGKNTNVSIVDGKAKLIISNLTKGKYIVEVTYLGNDKYLELSKSTTFNVISNKRVNLTGKNITMYFKDGTCYEITLTDKDNKPIANQTVYIFIHGINMERVTNKEGKASIAINLQSNNYTVTVTYKGTQNYDSAKTSNKIIVLPTIISKDIVKIFKNDTQYYVKLLRKDGKPLVKTEVEFNIYGVFYKRTTNENGIARLNINLRPGTYILTAENPVNGEKKSNYITVLSSIQGENIVKYFKNGTQYYAKFLNKDGSPLKNTAVKFNIYGVFYTRTTNEFGIAKLNINLSPGKYIITAINPVNDEMFSNNITVLSKLIGHDLIMSYKDGSSYKVKLLDDVGKPVKNVSLTFNIYGVFYQRVTNIEGIAKLNINLMPGEYIVTVNYYDSIISNIITVKSR